MTAADPREIIDRSPMTTAQIVVVAITVLLNAMDGFDILSIAFAGNAIKEAWQVPNDKWGFVASMELVGMCIGSIFLGGLADRIGRRSTLLGCLVTMIVGMFGAASMATNTIELSIWRVITGLGIGGMLSCTNAVVAEFSNKKWRRLCISLMVIGYPLGGAIGGLWASSLIQAYGWQSVFYLGAGVTALLLPLAFFFVPESVHWLVRKQPKNALALVNGSLGKLGYAGVAALPEMPAEDRKKSLGDIFSPALISTTVIVTAAYFLHIVSFYFLAKWLPLITAAVFPPGQGGPSGVLFYMAEVLMPGTDAPHVYRMTGPFILALTNFGGAAGGVLFGLLAGRIGLKQLTIIILMMNALAIALFGYLSATTDLVTLTWLALGVGFFGNAAISGMYSIVAYAFPTHVRATGTGFVIGVGRGGAVLSPNLAGWLFGSALVVPKESLWWVALIMGAGSLLAAVALLFLKLSADKPVVQDQKQPVAEFRTRTA